MNNYLRNFGVLGIMSFALGFLSLKEMPRPEPIPEPEIEEEVDYFYGGRIITSFEEYDWYERNPNYTESI